MRSTHDYPARLSALWTLLISVTVCATSSPAAELKPRPPALKPDQARLYFFRAKNYANVFKPDLLLNGIKIGEVTSGCFYFIDVKPGPYKVIADNDLTLWVYAGESKYISFGFHFGDWKEQLVPELVDEKRGLANMSGLEHCELQNQTSQAGASI